MPSRVDILMDPEGGDRMDPLLTDEEIAVWSRRYEEARAEHAPSDHNGWERGKRVMLMMQVQCVSRMQARPDPLLNAMILIVGSRGQDAPVTVNEIYTDDFQRKVEQYDTPETRWWTDKILEGLAHMPRSYAVSAATRYFRGIGKQAKLDKPGVGLLGTVNGWKEREVKSILHHFYDARWNETRTYIGTALMSVEDQGVYSDAAMDYDEQDVDELYESGGAFSATRVERDDEFIKTLRDILAKRGMTQPPLKTNPKKPPKPHKRKNFAPGSVVKARHVRDIPQGTVLKAGERTFLYGFPKEGIEYIWYGKNKNGIFIIEDPTEKKGSYFRYINVTTKQMDGMVVMSLPKARGPDDFEASDATV